MACVKMVPRQESNDGLKPAWILDFGFFDLKSTVKNTVIFQSVPIGALSACSSGVAYFLLSVAFRRFCVSISPRAILLILARACVPFGKLARPRLAPRHVVDPAHFGQLGIQRLGQLPQLRPVPALPGVT